MDVKQALETQYGLMYRIVEGNLQGLSHEDSLKQPQPGGNCANWILGHMVGAQNTVMSLLNEEPVWDDASLERAGSEPITGAGEALDWSTMRDRFLASKERCMSGLARLSAADLDEGGFTDPFGEARTRGEFLNLMAVHQNYHAGQLGLSRRLAGHPGAIRAPQPQS